MASKNGRWTSMFKSKPCNTHHQWQLDRNTLSGVDAEEKTPDPKPRWNPKAEQIRILEGIFNSGIVNPPRDEIKRIRVQLQEYGQVGDANVFYWFQNRKSRNKHKIKQLRSRQSINCPTKINHTTTTTASASVPAGVSNSPTKSVNNKTPHTDLPDLPTDLLFQSKSPFEFKSSNVKHSRPWNQQTVVSRQQNQQEEFMLTDIYEHDNNIQNAAVASKEKNHSYQTTPVNTIVAPSITATTTTTSATTQDPFNGLLQGMPEETSTYVDVAEDNLTQTKRVHGIRGISRNRDSRVIVLINEVEFEVGAGHFNVREAFGTGAVLFHSSGLPVLLNDWGFTLHPLQQGASYFLV